MKYSRIRGIKGGWNILILWMKYSRRRNIKGGSRNILVVEIYKVDPIDFVATGCSKLFHRDRPTGRNRRLLELDCNRVEYCIFYLSFEFEFWAYSVCNSDLVGETEGYWNLVFPRLLQSKMLYFLHIFMTLYLGKGNRLLGELSKTF